MLCRYMYMYFSLVYVSCTFMCACMIVGIKCNIRVCICIHVEWHVEWHVWVKPNSIHCVCYCNRTFIGLPAGLWIYWISGDAMTSIACLAMHIDCYMDESTRDSSSLTIALCHVTPLNGMCFCCFVVHIIYVYFLLPPSLPPQCSAISSGARWEISPPYSRSDVSL